MANGHGNGGFVGFMAEHWWKILGGAVGLGASVALLKAQVAGKADQVDVERLRVEVNAKADKAAVDIIQRDLSEMKAMMGDMNERQRAFFCRNQPTWCR